MTCQWKGHIGSEGLFEASLQGARDGACIVNYLREFYESAGQPLSVVDTCHWSVTCDMVNARLWIHWAEPDVKSNTLKHHMRLVDHQPLRAPMDPTNAAMATFRQYLRNILIWSLDARLKKIKAAIPLIQQNSAPGSSNKRQKISK